MKKATEDQFNELHSLVTTEFLKRVKSGEASTQDLKAACDWLKTNDISGIAYEGSPLDKLANVIPQLTHIGRMLNHVLNMSVIIVQVESMLTLNSINAPMLNRELS